MIKCVITIENKGDDTTILASMPEVLSAPEIEHVIAKALVKKIDELIQDMAVLGDIQSMEGVGKGAEAIKAMLKKQGRGGGLDEES